MNDERSTSPRAEFLLGLVIFCIGAFLLWSAEDIPVSGEDDFGARSLPRAISTMIAVLGAIWSAIYFVKWRHSVDKIVAQTRNRYLFTRIIPLMLSSFVYAFLFQWFGYLVSTFLIAIPVLYLFGHTSVQKVLMTTVVVTGLYYFIFIKALGVFDPGGSIFNINKFLGI
jgi:putative tricarboxylic transport membrane protein